VMLAVSDNGTGMDKETRSHVFEPFFTTKEAGKGTGLGLSTAYGIVKQSGGSIEVYSEPEHGTTFKVYLPRADAPLEPRAEAPPASAGGSETILLVEDEDAVRAVSTRILRDRGYTVLVAASGEEALEASSNHDGQVHLLLTDLIMPGMNGRELADRLRVSRPDTRVILASGYADGAIAREDVLDARVDFIQKPFKVDNLARKVRSVLDREP